MGLLGVWKGTYVTAKCAKDYIDAEGIISDANNIKKQLNEIDNLVRNINNSASDLTRDVLSVDDKDMSGNVEYTIEYINNVKVADCSCLDEIIQRATTLYNEKQEEYNSNAQSEDRRLIEQNRRKK